MTKSEALNEISSILQIPAEKIDENIKLDQAPGWDSLGHIAIISFLDTEFSIQLTTSEMMELTTVGAILDVIKLKNRFDN